MLNELAEWETYGPVDAALLNDMVVLAGEAWCKEFVCGADIRDMAMRDGVAIESVQEAMRRFLLKEQPRSGW